MQQTNLAAMATILIVEDSLIQAEMLRRLLMSAGYFPHVAKDGMHGLAMIQQVNPHLVISDISMPNMDGYEFCSQIKKNPSSCHIPVILLTELSDPKEIIRGLNAGADNYITKPYDENELLDHVKGFLYKKQTTMNQDPLLHAEEELTVAFAGEEHTITSNRQQILHLLLSTYENAVQRNRELIKTQQALQLLNEHLEEKVRDRTRQLEDANRLKSEFIANVSHETRTPMNAIIGMTNLVLDSNLDEEQKRHLLIVKKSADALMILLNSMLNYSLLQVGELHLRKNLFSLRSHLLELCRPFAERLLQEKGLGFTCQVSQNTPDALLGDTQRLSEILTHLLDNALKFTHQGEVILTVKMDAQVENSTCLLHYKLTDTGIGIAKERQSALFTPFAQGDGSSTRRYGGTGIGLSLVKQLVELMEGSIQLISEVGQGSSFLLIIPLTLANPTVIDRRDDSLETLLYHPFDPDHPAALTLDWHNEDAAHTWNRDEVLHEAQHKIEGLTAALQANDAERVEKIGQWIKKAASDILDCEVLKEEAFRLILAVRKGDFAKCQTHRRNMEIALASCQ